ncbi:MULTISPECIES: response regulator transcription factor [Gordonibacter]|uniref:Helix-turn-helix transcriptional regulator n=1 Tax=Gordonibacter faecis TaxID=3047475 RepID=A0ABT7DJP3_9ACTN|nr:MULTISPECIES: helix-turn-helix transcriptional regulator [unclassified Gordonibacter]MDJ1649737.1 helix-turn-helix transcriptional regulator [Gordonibacter sp. KGMB12511]HIW76540.1 helix-turn-helix transcriptional regulator [Candidatus Gordonibacter avicola]
MTAQEKHLFSEYESTRAAESDGRDLLIGNSSRYVILGIVALAAYWAWIFSIFHANVLNPFAAEEFNAYLMLCVIVAGSSALSMGAFVLFGCYLQRMVDRMWFTVGIALLSLLTEAPAFLGQVGGELSFPQAGVLFAIGGFASSFIYLKTGPFFVWLRRAKLMRSIALAFLLASLLYFLPLFMTPVVGISLIASFPVASVACSHLVNKGIGPKRLDAAESCSAYRTAILERLREFVPTLPRTLLYTLIFGVTSYAVLKLAVEQGMVMVIAASIAVSSLAFAVYVLSKKVKADSDLYRMLLLPLIALAVLPFPYVPEMLKIFFLTLIIFGFTCFDAITWGDLADEISDRQLPIYVSYAPPTIGNFFGIFIGWSVGALLYAELGQAEFDTGYSIFSIIIVIALVMLLVWDLIKSRKEESGEPQADAFLDKWKAACEEIAETHELTNQETRIHTMLARGRNQHYIAEELFISPHTIKTHTYHIYKKLGIHSQQELIDMVEAKL